MLSFIGVAGSHCQGVRGAGRNKILWFYWAIALETRWDIAYFTAEPRGPGPFEVQNDTLNRMNGAEKMKFRPLHDRVVVRRVEGDERTAGGIIIPDTAKEKPQEGEIIAVGAGARDESGKVVPLDVKAGDRVLFGKWSGTEVKIDGEDLLIMKESDIMGVIENSSAKKKAA
jgi:chaperonin GroES